MSGTGDEVPVICCSLMLYALMDGKFTIDYINGYRKLVLGNYAITYCPYCGDRIMYNPVGNNDCFYHIPKREEEQQ